jgi:crotonobetainyl-CoA:carnitine CoA-transferase CaiB-like acyl-CoA transferase
MFGLMAPLAGIRVVEAALGVSVVGAGLASSLPGSLLRDLGADVARVQSRTRSALDQNIEFAPVWNRGKELTETDDDTDPAASATTIKALARDADILLLAGVEDRIDRQGLAYQHLARENPRLIVVRIRPSGNARGALHDLELLVAARAGLLSQIRAHRPGPAFADLAIASAGAGLSAAVGALSLLYQREGTGQGGWAQTSLYDGITALLPMIIGRVEHHSPTTKLLWQNRGPSEALSYRCADGEYVQLWFGAKGAFDAFLAHIGDPPSERGYNAELMSDAMAVRGERWAKLFATRDRDWWLKNLAGQKFRCEPVLRAGEALRDPHVRATNLSERHNDQERGTLTVLGPAIRVTAAGNGRPQQADGSQLLNGVNVLDLSAYLAGPIAPLMQALAGVEAGQGGAGQPPTYLVWGAIDAAGGWMSACGILAGLYARRSRGGGQSVSASLLGAALTLKSGAFIAAGEVVGGPVLDPGQTGYGAAYRIYRGAEGAWFALAVPDEQAWRGLLSVVDLPQLPNSTPSLRTDRGDSQPEELLLEAAFRTRPAAAWVAALRAEGVPVEPVATPGREGFAAGFTDDPVNRQLGRVVGYRWGDHGAVRQPSFPPRIGPGTPPPANGRDPRTRGADGRISRDVGL